jgi:hypothetical protein
MILLINSLGPLDNKILYLFIQKITKTIVDQIIHFRNTNKDMIKEILIKLSHICLLQTINQTICLNILIFIKIGISSFQIFRKIHIIRVLIQQVIVNSLIKMMVLGIHFQIKINFLNQ